MEGVFPQNTGPVTFDVSFKYLHLKLLVRGRIFKAYQLDSRYPILHLYLIHTLHKVQVSIMFFLLLFLVLEKKLK